MRLRTSVPFAVNASRLTGSDPTLAGAAVLGLGVAGMLALAGLATRDLSLTLAGGVAALAALGVLLVGGWLDGPSLVAATVPLPALYGGAGVRVAFVAPVAALVVVAWALRRSLAGDRPRHGLLPRASLVVLFAVFVVAAAASDYPLDGAREVLNFGVILALLVVATDEFSRAPVAAERAAAVFSAVGAACGGLAALESLGVIPGKFPLWDSGLNRAALGFGQPNGLGLYLAMAVPLVLYQARAAGSRAGRIAWGIGFACVLAGLAGTFSRGAWLAAVVGAGALVFAGRTRATLGIWLWALLAALALDVLTRGAVHERLAVTLQEWTVEQRAALALAGLFMFLAHPILGVGPGAYAPSLTTVGAQITQLFDYQPTPHNAFVQAAAEEGVVGLIVFVWFLGTTLRALVRAVKRDAAAGSPAIGLKLAVLWSFAAGCVASFVVWPFAHGTGEGFVLVVALGLAIPDSPPGTPGSGEAAA